jgi:hypothetical protein
MLGPLEPPLERRRLIRRIAGRTPTDVKFETVRSLSQTDLFSEVRKNGDALSAMVAFLSLGQSFLTDQRMGVFFSIGTDASDPGHAHL